METKWISLAAVVLSALACVMSGVALLGRPQTPVMAGAGQDPSAAQVQELGKQIAELRAEVERPASAKLASPEPHTPREPLAGPGTVPPDVQKRLTSLEESVAILLRQAKERPAAPKAAPGAERTPKELQLVATDPRANEQEKLAALKALRGTDAITHDVMLAMIGVAEQSQDETVREDVYRNLHGEHDPSLRDSELRALASDPSAKVRKKVAQDIDTFLPDALVASALRQAADYDADPGVREQASKTLSSAR